MSTRIPKIVGVCKKMPPQQKVELAGTLDFRNCQKKTISTPASVRTSKRLQIDPLLLLSSNRKPGSLYWLHMFSLYFCFRFSRYGPSHSVNYRTRDHVWLTISRPLIPLFQIFFQVSIVRRKVYRVTENLLSKYESDATAKGQTCAIVQYVPIPVVFGGD